MLSQFGITLAFDRLRPDIAWIPVTDIEPLRIALGRRTNDDTALVRNFTDVVTELLAEQPPPPRPSLVELR